MIRSSFSNGQTWPLRRDRFQNEPEFQVTRGTEYTRAEVHELVWQRPMSGLAEIMGVSTTTIREACSRYSIPVPARGYWSKVRAGKPVEPTPLPKRPPGMSDTLYLGGAPRADLDELVSQPPEPIFDQTIVELRKEVSQRLAERQRGWEGLPLHPAMEAIASSDNANRRHNRILSTLFHAVAEYGAHPRRLEDCAAVGEIAVHHQRVAFQLLQVEEAETGDSDQARVLGSPAERRLALTLPRSRRGKSEKLAWEDTENESLEAQVAEIATEIVVLAEVQQREAAWRIHERRLEDHNARLRRMSEKQARAFEETCLRQKHLEDAKLQMLLTLSVNLQHAQTLRSLVDDVLAAQGGALDDRTLSWAKFVQDQADRLDPTLQEKYLDVMRFGTEDFERGEAAQGGANRLAQAWTSGRFPRVRQEVAGHQNPCKPWLKH